MKHIQKLILALSLVAVGSSMAAGFTWYMPWTWKPVQQAQAAATEFTQSAQARAIEALGGAEDRPRAEERYHKAVGAMGAITALFGLKFLMAGWFKTALISLVPAAVIAAQATYGNDNEPAVEAAEAAQAADGEREHKGEAAAEEEGAE